VADRYPNDRFLLITKKPFQDIFIYPPENLEVIPIDTKRENILTVSKRLRFKYEITGNIQVADLHSVSRSWLIDLSLWLKGKKVAIIHKGKKEKRKLTRKTNKQFIQLETSIERYQKVFEKLGYNVSLDFKSLLASQKRKNEKWIGIAPFAKHQGKTYPLEQMEEVIRLLNCQSNVQLFLFGGKDNHEKLTEWAAKYENVQSVTGKQLSFPDELRLINDLDVMVSMDSANMHLASVVNTPVISIWGATHPYSGFYGYNQRPENIVQLDLKCRPCSVFGNKPCMYGTYDCLNQIKPETIVAKVMNNE
jgi:ADP-heptose:LPS heptosyltransferase